MVAEEEAANAACALYAVFGCVHTESSFKSAAGEIGGGSCLLPHSLKEDDDDDEAAAKQSLPRSKGH